MNNNKPLIFKVAIPNIPLFQLFDYSAPDNNHYDESFIGSRLIVPFGDSNKKHIGFLIKITDTSECDIEKLKRVIEILDKQSLLTKCDIQFLHWLSNYYHTPLGEVISAAFPLLLRKVDSARIEPIALNNEVINVNNKSQAICCNPEQQAAIDTISASLAKFHVFLLEGVTGSGKTEVYMQVIEQVLAKGLQVLVLIPEISLTPQLEHHFKQRFSYPIYISHSRLSDKERLMAWQAMRQGTNAVLLGTRSALFTPLPKAGLIILDEEHDTSFKQQDGFRFSARDSAIVRAKLLNIPILLASATPSLESLYNCEQKRYEWLHLPQRAGNAQKPQLQLIDIRNKKMRQGLSQPLISEIEKTLARHEQVLIFLNRRGFAPTLICHDCGWVARCLYCDANLVIHQKKQILRCHHCDKQYVLFKSCPQCQSLQLTPLGLGTERVEQTLQRLFPHKRLARLDLDSIKAKDSLNNYLEQITKNEIDIILGTQLLAKGHHFPNVTLVALLNVDSGLFSIDFHASEKLAQLITQVAGRAGRAEKKGKVLLQTRQPQHPLLTTLIQYDYRTFALQSLIERKQAQLPPFSYQALLRAGANSHDTAKEFLQTVMDLANSLNTQNTLVLGPVPAPMLRRIGQCRYQVLLQNNNRTALQQFLNILVPQITQLKQASKVRWSIDIDPVDLY